MGALLASWLHKRNTLFYIMKSADIFTRKQEMTITNLVCPKFEVIAGFLEDRSPVGHYSWLERRHLCS